MFCARPKEPLLDQHLYANRYATNQERKHPSRKAADLKLMSHTSLLQVLRPQSQAFLRQLGDRDFFRSVEDSLNCLRPKAEEGKRDAFLGFGSEDVFEGLLIVSGERGPLEATFRNSLPSLRDSRTTALESQWGGPTGDPDPTADKQTSLHNIFRLGSSLQRLHERAAQEAIQSGGKRHPLFNAQVTHALILDLDPNEPFTIPGYANVFAPQEVGSLASGALTYVVSGHVRSHIVASTRSIQAHTVCVLPPRHAQYTRCRDHSHYSECREKEKTALAQHVCAFHSTSQSLAAIGSPATVVVFYCVATDDALARTDQFARDALLGAAGYIRALDDDTMLYQPIGEVFGDGRCLYRAVACHISAYVHAHGQGSDRTAVAQRLHDAGLGDFTADCQSINEKFVDLIKKYAEEDTNRPLVMLVAAWARVDDAHYSQGEAVECWLKRKFKYMNAEYAGHLEAYLLSYALQVPIVILVADPYNLGAYSALDTRQAIPGYEFPPDVPRPVLDNDFVIYMFHHCDVAPAAPDLNPNHYTPVRLVQRQSMAQPTEDADIYPGGVLDRAWRTSFAEEALTLECSGFEVLTAGSPPPSYGNQATFNAISRPSPVEPGEAVDPVGDNVRPPVCEDEDDARSTAGVGEVVARAPAAADALGEAMGPVSSRLPT